MSEKENKYKKYFIIIVPILLIAVIVELILLLKPNNELKGNQVKPNYDEELKLADTILFDSANVSYDNTSSGLTSTKVQDAIDELYTAANTCTTNLGTCQSDLAAAQAQIPQTCKNSPFKLGDYIDMTPTTNTSTTISTLSGVSGSITPSELNVWRVIKVNPDCTVEVVSEYVSTTNIALIGKDGYKNMVYGLNEYAKLYANTTYTLDPATASDGAFRNVGYDGQTPKIEDETILNDTTLGTASGAGYQTSLPAENLGGLDSGFSTDINLLNKARVNLRAYKKNTTTFINYWLASRLFYWNSASNWAFLAGNVTYSGYVGSGGALYSWNGSRFSTIDNYCAIRPIITLQSGLTTASGNGTSGSHYTLSAS